MVTVRVTLPREEMAQLLFVDWVFCMAHAKYGGSGWGTDGAKRAWSTDTTSRGKIRVSLHGTDATIDAPSFMKDELKQIAADAHQRTHKADMGAGHWQIMNFVSRGDIDSLQLHMARNLNELPKRTYQGTWRLGESAFVTVEQAEKEKIPRLIPDFGAVLRFLVPGPGQGPFAAKIANSSASHYRTSLAFAFAAPATHNVEAFAMQTSEEFQRLEQDSRQRAQLPLQDSMTTMNLLGLVASRDEVGFEALKRAQHAMSMYEQAISQTNELVALSLFVSALEALGSVNTNWKTDKATGRFIAMTKDLLGDHLRETISHTNFADAFGAYTSPTRFLNELYELRSESLHAGQVHEPAGIADTNSHNQIRMMLVSEMVRTAIGNFIQSPRSPLTGHPLIDPPKQTVL